MTTETPSEKSYEDTIALLIETNPEHAERMLHEQGYSIDEWKRARNAPPALEHGQNAAAAPAIE